MKKFNNFTDFASHVKVLKNKKIEESIKRINTGIFIEDLSDFTMEQIKHIVPADKYEHLDYLFTNRKDIKYKECLIVKSASWISNMDTFSIFFTITLPDTGEVLELRTASGIQDSGIPSDLEIEIQDIYLKKSFIEACTVNDYSKEDITLIDLYKNLFNHVGPITQNTKHFINRKSKLIISDEIQFVISYELLVRKVIHAGLSKSFMKVSDTSHAHSHAHFSTKLRLFLENDYLMPILGKTINDLNDNDITVFQMHEI